MLMCVLASGSKGNSIFVGRPGRGILVDAGLSCRQLLKRMKQAGIDPGWVEALVITHEHTDHIQGAGTLARTLGVKMAASPGTWQAMGRIKGVEQLHLPPGQELALGGLRIRAFSVVHDAADPIGLVVEAEGRRVGIATDMGLVTHLVLTRLTGCQALVVEANHDPALLASGPYPPQLKQRIASTHGHLSNPAAARMLAQLMHQDLNWVVLAHLSEENNRPELAMAPARRVLAAMARPPRLTVACQHAPTPVIEL